MYYINHMPSHTYDSNRSTSNRYPTRQWADYHEDFLPIIPWAPHVKQVSLKSEPSEWTTVKSKKKRK